jgi:hypothetical protein
MRRHYLLALLVAFSCTMLGCDGAAPRLDLSSASTAPKQLLKTELEGSESVDFYTLTRTEDYDFGPAEFRKEATFHIYAYCGKGCAGYLNSFTDHLNAAHLSNCMKGQQNLLVEFGDSEIFYSYSGRQALYKGNCYWNDAGIPSPRVVLDGE